MARSPKTRNFRPTSPSSSLPLSHMAMSSHSLSSHSSLITKQSTGSLSSMERSTWPKNLSSSSKRAIQELCGQNPKKLRDAFDAHSQTGDDPRQPLFGGDPVVRVLGSFSSNTQSLSGGAESYEVSQVPSNACVMSGVSKGSESVESPFRRRRRDSRGLRKTSDTLTRLDHNLIDDGHQWRKYGQKMFLNAEFTRNYFRCAHLIDPVCQATKQVQQIQDNPPLYRTIYQGLHTCKNSVLKSPRLILDSPSPEDSSILVSFNTTPIPKQEYDNDDGDKKTFVTWTRLDHNLIDDGYLWREYGHKSILTYEFPRHYFRCAFRVDQGCLATKEVQKMQNDPPVYKTVCYGHHTCGNPIVESPQSSSIHQTPRILLNPLQWQH